MRKFVGWSLLALGLAGCGADRNDLVVTACETEVNTRLTGQTFSLDRADMRAKVSFADEQRAELNSSVVFDKGLPTEKTQTFTCRVQFDPNNPAAPPNVQSINFQW